MSALTKEERERYLREANDSRFDISAKFVLRFYDYEETVLALERRVVERDTALSTLRGALKVAEWGAFSSYAYDGQYNVCPSCKGGSPDDWTNAEDIKTYGIAVGHIKGCVIAKALAPDAVQRAAERLRELERIEHIYYHPEAHGLVAVDDAEARLAAVAVLMGDKDTQCECCARTAAEIEAILTHHVLGTEEAKPCRTYW